MPDDTRELVAPSDATRVDEVALALVNDDRTRAGWPKATNLTFLAMSDQEAYRSSARAAIAAMQPEGWQPIETAKIDCETEVDLWCEGLEGDGWLLRGIIYPGEPMWIKTSDGGDYFPHENGGWVTHWRPTPAAPLNRLPLPTAPIAASPTMSDKGDER